MNSNNSAQTVLKLGVKLLEWLERRVHTGERFKVTLAWGLGLGFQRDALCSWTHDVAGATRLHSVSEKLACSLARWRFNCVTETYDKCATVHAPQGSTQTAWTYCVTCTLRLSSLFRLLIRNDGNFRSGQNSPRGAGCALPGSREHLPSKMLLNTSDWETEM